MSLCIPSVCQTTGFQVCVFGDVTLDWDVTTFLLNECMMNRIRGEGLHRHLHVTDMLICDVQIKICVVYLSMRLFK